MGARKGFGVMEGFGEGLGEEGVRNFEEGGGGEREAVGRGGEAGLGEGGRAGEGGRGGARKGLEKGCLEGFGRKGRRGGEGRRGGARNGRVGRQELREGTGGREAEKLGRTEKFGDGGGEPQGLFRLEGVLVKLWSTTQSARLGFWVMHHGSESMVVSNAN